MVWVDAHAGKRELGQVGVANRQRTGGAQPGHARRVPFGGRGVVARSRGCSGGPTPDIEQVLDRHGQARERQGRAGAIDGVGRLSRCIVEAAHEAVRGGGANAGFERLAGGKAPIVPGAGSLGQVGRHGGGGC
jgi:hypothetical protein